MDAFDQNSIRRLHKGDPFKNIKIEALNLIRPDLAKRLQKKTESEEAEEFIDENDILTNDDPFRDILNLRYRYFRFNYGDVSNLIKLLGLKQY